MTGTPAGSRPLCWVLSDGKAGTEVQSIGLAEALGLEPEVKRLKIKAPWCWLPPPFWPAPLRSLGAGGAGLAPPWPEILIAGGRLTAAPAAAVRQAGKGATFAVQIQDSKIDPRHFDLVVTPEHDRLRGTNVVTTRGALHGVTPARLSAAAARLAPRLEGLPRPLVAVLIGGANRAYRFTSTLVRRLTADLTALARDQGASLLVTTSRRTGAEQEAALRAGLAGVAAEFWDGCGENPYLGYLALADALVVTADSITMISEAAATGKPVHVVELPGGTAKFRRFHAAMQTAGITRPFEGSLESWRYPPLDEPARIAAEIRRRLS